MAWNDQTSPVPNDGGRPDLGTVPTRPLDGAGSMGSMGGAAAGGFNAAQFVQPGNPAGPVPQMPAQSPPAAPLGTPPAGGSYAGPPMPAMPARVVNDQDQPDAHDDVWIERSKRAIAETQNDPFRQVQLLQHLNKLYLKERFGREVQADKG